MQAFIRAVWWAAVLLAGGCRSEQAVFTFQPAALPDATAAVQLAPATPPVPIRAAQMARCRTIRAQLLQPVAAAPRPARQYRSAKPTAPQPPRTETVAHFVRPTRLADTRDTLHLVLGAMLVATGVVTGLLLGGWLGLGVGALLVLIGYYFGLLGIGGRQAWLEVFQEFFNM